MLPNIIDRRRFLRNASAMCAVSALGSVPFASVSGTTERDSNQQRRPSPSRNQAGSCTTPCTISADFTIVLHGLFLIELWGPDDTHIPDDQKVRIFTPDCSHLIHSHVYSAGSWGMPFVAIQGYKDYYPKWNIPGAKMTTDKNLPEMAQQAGNVLRSGRYCSLYLPYPKSIRGLRSIQASAVSSTGTTSADFPLVTALTYGSDRPSGPPIPGAPWDSSANFHIFAEPDCIMSCKQMIAHGNETLKAAKKMLAAYDVHLANTVDCDHHPLPPIPLDECPPDKGAPGVRCEEEKSLWELPGAQPCPGFDKDKKQFAVHMPTCASIILTP
jgi:hypothetical protein